MKAWYIGLSLAVLIGACSLAADAKPKQNGPNQPNNDPWQQEQIVQNKKGNNHNGSNQPKNDPQQQQIVQNKKGTNYNESNQPKNNPQQQQIVQNKKGTNYNESNQPKNPNQSNNGPKHNSPGQPNNSPGYYGTGQPANSSNYENEYGYNHGPEYNNGPDNNGYNQPYNEPRYSNGQDYDSSQTQQHARSVLQRTGMVLLSAKQAAEHRHYITGLGRAVDHQRLAQELYRNGSYQDAIYHSLLARRLAEQILAGNGERLRPEYSYDSIELTYTHRSPRDADLDCRINPKKSILGCSGDSADLNAS